MKLIGFFTAGRYGHERAKGAAIFPLLIVRSEEYATPLLINHERIHFRQQIETLFVGLLILKLAETLYARVFLKLRAPDYNLYLAAEQEAYRNQHNMHYLENRPLFNVFSYIRNKRRLSFVQRKASEVIVGELWSPHNTGTPPTQHTTPSS